MSTSRRCTDDGALHRCFQAPRDRVCNTGATGQPHGEDLSSAVLQGHTAVQLKVDITQCMYFETQRVGLSECVRLPVLFVGARLTCSLGAGWPVHRRRSQWSKACTVCRCQEPQTRRLRPDIGSGTSTQPTLAVASSESGCVQVLAPTASSCTTNKSLVYNTIVWV